MAKSHLSVSYHKKANGKIEIFANGVHDVIAPGDVILKMDLKKGRKKNSQD